VHARRKDDSNRICDAQANEASVLALGH
jgi:hypothetical protein